MPATTTPHGVSLNYDTFGDTRHPAMVLIQGLGAHMLGWHEEFCRLLADGGHHIIRFDNRDVGLSQKFPAGGYTLADMADDTTGLLDALNIDTAHVVGQSMGAMIAQLVAIRHPARVKSLALIYSTPKTDFIHGIELLTERLDTPRPGSRVEAVDQYVKNESASASTRYPRDVAWLRELGGLMYDRCHDPDGVRRQTQALQNAEDLTPLLCRISTPTTILHGSDDRLIAPAASTLLHDFIEDSVLTIHSGMGHELPRPLWDDIVGRISENAQIIARRRPNGEFVPTEELAGREGAKPN
ncbi:MAG TPA: alpha/beta hydrolase [Pseudonocardia sp.]|nr:alpha/beta hydrolase [Pseudonocardia sp.]